MASFLFVCAVAWKSKLDTIIFEQFPRDLNIQFIVIPCGDNAMRLWHRIEQSLNGCCFFFSLSKLSYFGAKKVIHLYGETPRAIPICVFVVGESKREYEHTATSTGECPQWNTCN